MERHPALQFVFTEQGTEWLPTQLATLDAYMARMSGAASSTTLATTRRPSSSSSRFASAWHRYLVRAQVPAT